MDSVSFSFGSTAMNNHHLPQKPMEFFPAKNPWDCGNPSPAQHWRHGKSNTCHLPAAEIPLMDVDGRDPTNQLIGRLSRYLQGSFHPRWFFGISEPSTGHFSPPPFYALGTCWWLFYVNFFLVKIWAILFWVSDRWWPKPTQFFQKSDRQIGLSLNVCKGRNNQRLFELPPLVGGWTNPSEKYARQNGFIFPK